ncbi:MAG TPA: hypothetical protein VNP92_11835 [Actinophytocola sp.]|nr:hypothetical protein [Actinophytocola sp.]
MSKPTRSRRRLTTRRPQQTKVARLSDSAQRWLKRAAALVVTLGAIAGAVTTIKALWPDDPEDRAALNVRVIPQVRLSDYARMLSSAAPQGFRMQPTEDPPLPDEPAEPTDPPICCEETDIPPTDVDPPDPPDPSVPANPDPTSPVPPNNEVLVELPPPEGVTHEEVNQAVNNVVEQTPGCGGPINAGSCTQGLRDMTVAAFGGKSDTVEAAERVVDMLKDSLKTVDQEPIGAIVTVELELTGLKNVPVELTWLMSHVDGGDRLPPTWLLDHFAYQHRPGTQHDTFSVPIWVPLPAAAGPYFVEVAARIPTGNLDSTRSVNFG